MDLSKWYNLSTHGNINYQVLDGNCKSTVRKLGSLIFFWQEPVNAVVVFALYLDDGIQTS